MQVLPVLLWYSQQMVMPRTKLLLTARDAMHSLQPSLTPALSGLVLLGPKVVYVMRTETMTTVSSHLTLQCVIVSHLSVSPSCFVLCVLCNST